MSWMQTYRSRLKSASEAVAGITDGNQVYLGSGCATPHELVAALTDRAEELKDVDII
jgi:acyl-CoA hydrolase